MTSARDATGGIFKTLPVKQKNCEPCKNAVLNLATQSQPSQNQNICRLCGGQHIHHSPPKKSALKHSLQGWQGVGTPARMVCFRSASTQQPPPIHCKCQAGGSERQMSNAIVNLIYIRAGMEAECWSLFEHRSVGVAAVCFHTSRRPLALC